ncbi:TPA: hypothetical protein EYO63_01165 [Candidatus Poribacteria bacterium]|nr:hypothetical protein [Candidatus Poribacteria bacterium]HIO50666.1 hypothetical protein [Candidatus Poribacteria bacterium]HIO80459.1 hypothetical protein [Candidatus Poribacteria bacterium]
MRLNDTGDVVKIVAMFILLIIAGSLLYTDVNAEEDQKPLYLFRSARASALGNAYEAIADDIYAVHYNPAGLTNIGETIFQLMAVRGRFTSDVVEEASTMQDFVNETIVPLTDSNNPLMDPTLSAQREALVTRAEEILKRRIGFGLDLPAFGLVLPMADRKLALGVSFIPMTQTNTSFRIVKRGLPWPDPVMEMFDNQVIYRVAFQGSLATAVSYNHDLNASFLKSIKIGAGLRLIRRSIFTDEDNPFMIADVLNPDEFKKNYFNVGDEGFSGYARDNFETSTGYSVDLGSLLTPMDGLNLGLTFRNLVSGISDQSFPPNFTMAVAAKPFSLLNVDNNLLDLTLAASWDDPNGDDNLGGFALDQYTDHIHLGAEVRLLPGQLVEVALRAGNNQGFPTVGTGLRIFKFLNLDVAWYGDLEADWLVGSMEVSF